MKNYGDVFSDFIANYIWKCQKYVFMFLTLVLIEIKYLKIKKLFNFKNL